MRRRGFLAAGTAAFAGGFAPASALVPRASLREKLATRAESTGYREGSGLSDVLRFIAELDQRGAPISHGSVGKTSSGVDIPYVVASRPMVRTPAQALALRRPLVLVVAATDGSTVEGTEAMLAIVRDLCLSPAKTLLDDVVLVVVPLFDVDGSERAGPASANAPDENGPARVGTRATAQDIDLENDFVRAQAQETRALLRFVRDWRPDVYVDLTSSDGSFHEFGVTYAPSLHPAAYYGGVYVRDRLLPAVRTEMRAKFGIETFSFGHFGRTAILPEPPPPTDVANFGWFPRDYRPRMAVNYMGLRGILAVLVSAYAHDPLERRIFTTRAFVESILGFSSDNDDEVSVASHTSERWIGGTVPVRASLAKTPTETVAIPYENLALDSNPDHEPGVPIGFKRTGTYGSAMLPVYARYDGTTFRLQAKTFVVPGTEAREFERLLKVHAIDYEVAKTAQAYLVEEYYVESIAREPVTVNGRAVSTLSGTWREARPYTTKPGDLLIPVPQPFGPLVSVLLEPESDDGFVAWGVFGDTLAAGSPVPLLRVVSGS